MTPFESVAVTTRIREVSLAYARFLPTFSTVQEIFNQEKVLKIEIAYCPVNWKYGR